MERPGLKQLLADIALQKIDVVVVYKVDRLTRSLADFAKIVEIFDGHGVSFVSVTQAFNTTSSMGRLTLNVLLSFAQFEREVTGERIRDKIAASKKKGMWLIEVARVLKPGGRLLFAEHGRAPDAGVFKWQGRLTPLWKKLASGCHLDRDIPELLRKAGFETLRLHCGYIAGPRLVSFNFVGAARPV
jgi:SAM-dependent methyltransferase